MIYTFASVYRRFRMLWFIMMILVMSACSQLNVPPSTPMATVTDLVPVPVQIIPSTPTKLHKADSNPTAIMSANSSAFATEYSTDYQNFLPAINADSGKVIPSMTPSPPINSIPTALPVIDFISARDHLNVQGKELSYFKIGFHVTFVEDKTIIDNWMQQLDAAGVPFVLKTVDNAEPLFIAQQMMTDSGVPHILIFRSSATVPNLPDYELSPQQAAREHWEIHKANFPPELDPSRVWLETINEPDRLRADWLAEFALETARLAMADGFRWAAFGWASGEPEPEQWQSPAMLEFLQLAGKNPDRLAIALHEGSGTVDDAAFEYPFRTGRFLKLFEIADQNGIPRPTVLITELGWAYNDIPPIDQALDHLDWVAQLYAPFPEVQGAAIWNLGVGCCYGNISEKVEDLVNPLAGFALTHVYERPLPPAQASTNPDLYAP